MKYQLVDESKIPAARSSASKLADQKRQLTSKIILDLTPDRAAAVTPEKAETVRGVKSSLTRAGNREGRAVRVWDVDGTVYVALQGDAS